MKKIPFNTDWECISWIDAASEGGKRKVDLPDDYIINSTRNKMAISGAFSGYYSGGTGTYIKRFDLPCEWKDKTVIFYVDGAYMRSNIVINGEYVKSNMNGYSPFAADLTRWLREKNTLRIETTNHQPNSRWYSGGGVYRQVYILLGNELYIPPEEVFITTPVAEAEETKVRVGFGVRNTTAKNERVKIKAEVFFGEKKICGGDISMVSRAGEVTSDHIMLTIEEPMRWSTDEPNLYKAVICIEKDGQVIDEHEQIFGVRKLEFDAKKGMRLNGESIKLKGGCIHHDHGMLGAAAYPAAEERKIRIMKELGYNAIRTAHNPVSSTFLDICDRVGMLVLEEAFDNWVRGKRSNDYHVSFRDCWRRDLSAMVLRDRNHPCIFCWSIGNEVDEFAGSEKGLELTKELAACVRSLDLSRPVTLGQHGVIQYERAGIAVRDYDFEKLQAQITAHPGEIDGVDYWGAQTERHYAQLDIAGYNYIWPRYKTDAKKYPDRIIMATETHPYTMYDYWKAALENDNCIGDFIWTAFDNLGEAGTGRVIYDPEDKNFAGPYPWLANYQGDVAIDGSIQPQGYYHKILWGLDDGIHLFTYHPEHNGEEARGTGWHWYDVSREWTFDEKFIGTSVTAEAYADCDKVEFLINGESVGFAVPERYMARLEIPYNKGRLEAVAYRNGAAVARDMIETVGLPERIVIEAEKNTISADGLDLAYVRAYICDSEGRVVTDKPVEVYAETEGEGRMWLGSGNPCTEENFGTGRRYSWQGSVLAVVGATHSAGDIVLKFSADGFDDATVVIKAE